MYRGTVAIIGRPNVGKSTLFNSLVGHRVSIIDPTAGVTRDRLFHRIKVGDDLIDIVDTGGIGIVDAPQIAEHVEGQIATALESADAIIFLVDVAAGVAPLDVAVAEKLRRMTVPVILAANKADNQKLAADTADFFKLGLGEPIPISALLRQNLSTLMEVVTGKLTRNEEAPEYESIPKIAIVGRRNVGKSSLVNRLTQTTRVVVSDLPGTTRDAVDVMLDRKGKNLILIDTAGMRKRSQMNEPLEYYSTVRTENAISRCDVVLLTLSAPEEIAKVDKQIAKLILEEYKPCVIAVNKWDLADGKTSVDDYIDYVRRMLPFITYAPITFMSAKDGLNVWKTVELCMEVAEQAAIRVPTAILNTVVQEAQKQRMPRGRKVGVPKIYYATQVGINPPTIVVFVNHTDYFGPGYTRYLTNRLRSHLDFPEIPIKLIYRERQQKEE